MFGNMSGVIKNSVSDSEVRFAVYKGHDVVLKAFDTNNKSLIMEAGIYQYIKTNILDTGKSINFVEFFDFVADPERDKYILVTKTVKNFVPISRVMCKDVDEYNSLIFQLFGAIYVMNKYGIHHNDLHSGNILLEKLEQKMDISLKVDDETFVIPTKYILKIFDFDHSVVDKTDESFFDVEIILSDDDIHPLVKPYKYVKEISLPYLTKLYSQLFSFVK